MAGEPTAFESELRSCVEAILGVPVPTPDYEPGTFLRQWLAERNLGLVPVADAAGFASSTRPSGSSTRTGSENESIAAWAVSRARINWRRFDWRNSLTWADIVLNAPASRPNSSDASTGTVRCNWPDPIDSAAAVIASRQY